MALRPLSFLICLAFICSLLLFGCKEKDGTKNYNEREKKLKVLSTTAMIDDLVRQIGGDYVETKILIRGDLDPHTYQLVKGDDEKLVSSDLIFYNGLGLEHGPGLLQHLKQSGKSASLGDYLLEVDPKSILLFDGQPDPHIWMDLHLFSQTVPYLVDMLSQKDKEHASIYVENGKHLQEILEKNHQALVAKLSQLPEDKRYLVTSHDAFHYFTRAYLALSDEVNLGTWQKRCQAPEGLSPEGQLSTRDIKRIVNHLKSYNISVLFSESNVNKDSIRKIIHAGKRQGLQISIAPCSLYADAMGPKGSLGDTYLKMLWHNADQIATCLIQNDIHTSN